ncbi:hypothetical protein BGZ89_002664 [Linnemannia elongata]|nr:hypothetical protein BGZ89_002664 [Linnemannia elongata]
MAGGNQTRLGLVHQKPGTRRTLNGKRAVNPAGTTDDGKTERLLPTERLLEKAGALTQTMEEKLMEYRKGKEEEKRAKNTPPAASTRSSRSTTKRTEEAIKDDSTQRNLRSMMQASTKKTTTTSTTTTATLTTSATSSTTTLTESITIIDNTDITASKASQDEQDEEPEAQDDDDTLINRDAQVQTNHVEIVLEKYEVVTVESSIEQQTEQKSDDTGEDSVVPIQEGSPRRQVVRKEVVKPVAKDTAHVEEEEDEDNIHPLARTVVKSTRPIHRKPDTDDTSNHDSIDKAHQPVNIPSKSPRKIVVQESNVPETILPLPSHMDAMFELFKGLEQVLEFTKRQGQLCFYHKLRKHVELQSGRNFEIKHLAQLKTILPEGYKLTEAPCLFEGAKTRSILIDMLILKDESEGNFIPENEKRRKLFVRRLYDRIKSHHQLNLRNLGVRREIVKAPAKTVTITKEDGPSTSREKPQPVTAADFPPEAPVTKALSALEQLKERIRQKQLEKKDQGRGTASPEEKRQALIASRLPAVFDLIRFKRVDVLSLKALTEQVVKSSRQPISEVEGRESLEMMAKVLPEWCSVFGTNDGVKYFKVIRDDGHGNKILHDERALRTRLVTKSTSGL